MARQALTIGAGLPAYVNETSSHQRLAGPYINETGVATETSTGVLSFSGIGYAGVAHDTSTSGVLTFSGIAYVGAAAAVVTTSGVLTFRGIAYVGAGGPVAPTGDGVLSFSGLAIHGVAFDLGVGGVGRQFWTIGA